MKTFIAQTFVVFFLAAITQKTSAQVAQKSKDKQGDTVEFLSPLNGNFYLTYPNDDSPIVKEGDKVNEGEAICLVEFLNLWNEVEANFDGRIVKILAKEGEAVTQGQPLFKVKPNR